MSDLLKSVIQDLINDRTEQAQVSIHEYIVAKTQQIAGLHESDLKTTVTTGADGVKMVKIKDPDGKYAPKMKGVEFDFTMMIKSAIIPDVGTLTSKLKNYKFSGLSYKAIGTDARITGQLQCLDDACSPERDIFTAFPKASSGDAKFTRKD